MRYEQAFISDRAGLSLVDFLADELPLSKSRLKDAMAKGAVWLKAEGQEPERIRRSKHPVKLGDEIHIYYDEDFLNLRLPPFECLSDQQQYSIWLKPEGLMTEESLFCDHLTLPRLIETQVPADRDCYLLDPAADEIGGLLLMVHTRNCAAKFECLLEAGAIKKAYRAKVKGKCIELPGCASLNGQTVHINSAEQNAYDHSCDIVFHGAEGVEHELIEYLYDQGCEPAGLEDEISLKCCEMRFECPITGEPVQLSI